MKKKIISGIVIGSFTVASLALVSTFLHFGGTLVEGDAPTGAHVNTISLTADDITTGSGNVVINGNSFTYSNLTVNEGKIFFGAGSSIAFDDESGHSSTGTLRGAGFTIGTLSVADASSGQMTLNGYNMQYEMPENYVAECDINDTVFFMSVNSGSLSLNSLTLQYLCGEEVIDIDGLDNEYFYTSMVKSRTISANDGNDYKTSIYGVKRSDALYIYASQKVVARRDTGSNWWEKDNVEFRFGKKNVAPSGTHQYWYSSLNGGTASDGQVGVTSFNRDGYYEVNFEIKLYWTIMNGLGYYYDDEIYMTAGVAYANNTFRTSAGWDQSSFDCYEITSQGLVMSRILDVFSKTGVEVLDEPYSAEWPGGDAPNWNSTVDTRQMDGREDWMLRYEFDSWAHSTKTSDNAAGYVGEVYSPGWAQGGWTFRQDWWGWGSWNNVPGQEGNDGQHGHFVGATINDGNVFDAIDHMKVTAYIYFDSTEGRIYYVGQYKSKVEGFVDQYLYVLFYSTRIDYRGEMKVSFGYNFGGISFESIQLVEGSFFI